MRSANRATGLAVSMTMGFAAEWLTPRLARLKADTGLKIEVRAENRPVSLAGGGVDLAIRTRDEPGPDGIWRSLFEDRLIAVATQDLVAAHGIDPREGMMVRRLPLIRYRWASRERPEPSWARWLDGEEDGEDLTIAGDFDEESHAIRAALAGVGAALLSEQLVVERLAAGDLVRLGDHAIPLPPFWAVYREGHPRRREIESLIAWLAAQAG
jgi:LysR family glycine cleavage system transcriptional activator